jgi:hypothetical protein
VSRPALEVADIFRDHGAAWRRANAGHVSLGQMKAMSAIERCRTAALGGHVGRCETCAIASKVRGSDPVAPRLSRSASWACASASWAQAAAKYSCSGSPLMF